MDDRIIELEDHPELAEVARRLDQGETCRLTRHGRTIGHLVPEATWVDSRGRGSDWTPSPDDVAAFRRAAGSWARVDADQRIAEIYRWRDEAPLKPPVEL